MTTDNAENPMAVGRHLPTSIIYGDFIRIGPGYRSRIAIAHLTSDGVLFPSIRRDAIIGSTVEVQKAILTEVYVLLSTMWNGHCRIDVDEDLFNDIVDGKQGVGQWMNVFIGTEKRDPHFLQRLQERHEALRSGPNAHKALSALQFVTSLVAAKMKSVVRNLRDKGVIGAETVSVEMVFATINKDGVWIQADDEARDQISELGPKQGLIWL